MFAIICNIVLNSAHACACINMYIIIDGLTMEDANFEVKTG